VSGDYANLLIWDILKETS